jgi:hypothetical protein
MKSIQKIKALVADKRGAALIEFAIVIPALLWLLLAIIEFGIIFHLMSLSTYAANEAARKGKTGFTYGTADRGALIQETVRQQMDPWMGQSASLSISSQSFGTFNDVGVNGIPGQGGGGQLVLYTITFQWPVLTPVLGSVFGKDGKIDIESRVLVKNEEF